MMPPLHLKNPVCVSLALALMLIAIPVISTGQVTAYPFPEGALKSYRYEVTVNGVNTPVYMGHGAHFTQFSFSDDTARVVVNVIHGSFAWGVEIRPLKNRVVNPKIGVSTISFDICDSITQLSLEFNGHKIEPLFIFANPPEPESSAVGKNSDDTYYFGPGIHNPGIITLTEQKKKVFIDGGAYVKGCIHATNLDDVKISGRGILSGELYHNRPLDGEWHNLISLKGCNNAEIEDIIMYSSVGWNILLLLCNQVTVYNVKQISSTGNSDGVDVCGSNRVTIDHCFMYVHDDCIAFNNLVSCFNYPWEYGKMRPNSTHTRFTNSILWNLQGGVPIRIGWNTMCEHHSNLLFDNIDIIHCDMGSAISMNFGDAGSYRNIIFNNIRIEDVPEFLDLNMNGNTTCIDPSRGVSEANGLHFKNIHIREKLCDEGSRIMGANPVNNIKNVSFQNIRFYDTNVTSLKELNLETGFVESILFSEDTTEPYQPEIIAITSANPYRNSISWHKATDPESEIIHYNVYRNGEFVNISSDTLFIDNECKPQMKYTYQVSAVNAVGLESKPSLTKEVSTGGHPKTWNLLESIDGNTQGYGQFYYLTYNRVPLRFYRMPESGYDQLISGAFVYSTFRFWDMYFDGTDTWHSVSHAKRASSTVIDAQLTNGSIVSPHKDMDIAIGWKAPFDGEYKFEWVFSKMEPVSDSLSIRITRNNYDDVLSGSYFPGPDRQQSKRRDLKLKLKKDDFIFCIISSPSPDHQRDKIKVDVTVKHQL